MGEVTGPISTLPGRVHDLPAGTMCDSHPDRPAVARVQGETDLFGCEMYDLCAECLAEHRAYAASAEACTGRCDWCKERATDLANRRDMDEGRAGPVYRVCGACRKRDDARIAEEAAEWDDHYGHDESDDYDEEPF